jgi:hypothetical protein
MPEMDDIQFRTKPVDAAYRWGDVERRPALYPLKAGYNDCEWVDAGQDRTD